MRFYIKIIFLFVFLFHLIVNLNANNYYVNDGSSTGDIYCSTIGNNSNSGLTSSTPKLTLKNLWRTYGPSGTNVLTSGDTIFIDAGTYSATGFASVDESMFDVSIDGLTFKGAGNDVTIFDHNHHGSATEHFMYINANNISILDMTFQEYDNSGSVSGLHSGQVLTIGSAQNVLIKNVTFNSNGQSGGNPAVVVLSNSDVVIQGGGSFCNTAGTAYTGGIEVYGNNIDLLIDSSIIAYNYKVGSFDGAGLRIDGNNSNTIVTVKNSRIGSNDASGGGGISQWGGVLNVVDCIIENNVAGQVSTTCYGGGYRVQYGTSRFSRCTFINNASNGDGTLRGGAIAARYSTTGTYYSGSKLINITLDSCLFQANASSRGNDIYAGGSYGVTINGTDCQFLTGGNYNIYNEASTSSINVTYHGTTPTISGTVTRSVSVNSIFTPNPVAPDFSGTCGSITILPVEMINFSAQCSSDAKVELNWQTASEVNNDYFEVQKADDNMAFISIGKTSGKGNSSVIQYYSFLDNEPNSGPAYYRLKQVDFNGQYSYSDVITLKCIDEKDEIYIYPNPANENVNVLGDVIKVFIYDVSGSLVKYKNLDLTNSRNFSVSDLNSGIYFVQAELSSGKLCFEKISISH